MRIGIIKLGAKGDVVRTLPLARAIRKKYGDCEIVWITKSNIASLLQGNGNIDEIEVLPYNKNEKFDVLYNFDIDKEAGDLADGLKADKKFGFHMVGGYVSAFNPGAEYYVNTIFDDELKRKNKKTYQEMMFEVAELKDDGDRFEIELSKKERKWAAKFAKDNGLDGKRVIGIHMGSSPRWPSKAWHPDRVYEFIKKARGKGYGVILFSGPDEKDKIPLLMKKLESEKIKVFCNNPENSDREFAALMGVCDIVVCSDSFSLHVALGLGIKVVGLFFCTSPDEVEGYGLLRKVVSKKLYEFFPEKMNEYNEELVRSISSDEVLLEVEKSLDKNK